MKNKLQFCEDVEFNANKLFLPYNLALLAKEKGFNDGCIAKYTKYNPGDTNELFPHTQNFFKGYFDYCNNSEYIDNEKVAAPLYQQIIDWFETVHAIGIDIGREGLPNKYHGYIVKSFKYKEKAISYINSDWNLDKNEILNIAIEEAFKMID